MRRSDILGAVVLFLFGSVTAILSLQMPVGTLRTAGSGFFPLCLGLLLMVLAALFIVKALWSTQERGRKDAVAVEESGSWLQVVAFLTIMALATLLLNTLGYPIVSFLLMAGLLRILGFKRWPLNLTFSFLTAAGSHVFFVYLLKIPLPKGLLGI